MGSGEARTQRCSRWRLAGLLLQLRMAVTTAGPKDRVGLIEQPSIGCRMYVCVCV